MSTALLLGLIWSGLWMAFLYVIMKYFPWEMLHDYPEDVRKASTLPEPTGKQKRNAKIFSGIGSVIIFGALVAFGLLRFRAERADFLTLFWFLFIIAMSWNVIDLLVMDWLLVCTVPPAWLIIPGTAGKGRDLSGKYLKKAVKKLIQSVNKDLLYFFSGCFPDHGSLGIVHPLFQTCLNF